MTESFESFERRNKTLDNIARLVADDVLSVEQGRELYESIYGYRPDTGRPSRRPWWRSLIALMLFFVTFLVVVAAAISFGLGVAKADGVISEAEAAYVSNHHRDICGRIESNPRPDGVLSMVGDLVDEGFAPDSAADVVNATVATYCDQWWPLLERTGEQARSRDSVVRYRI